VYAFVYARTFDRQTAEDLTSQIFIKILQALPHYQNKAPFAAWVFTIARNTLNSHFRSADHRLIQNLENQFLYETKFNYSPRQHARDVETGIDLQRVLNELPDKDRELLSLRYAADLSYKEIGRIRGKRPEAVKMALHRLLRKVKERMEKTNESKH